MKFRWNDSWQEFGHDFVGGFKSGLNLFGKAAKGFHSFKRGIDQGKKVLEGLSNVPVLNDTIRLVLDDPALAEVLMHVDYVDSVISDVERTEGDIAKILETGRFTAGPSPSGPPRIPHMRTGHAGNIYHPQMENPTTPQPLAGGPEGAVPFDAGFRSPIGLEVSPGRYNPSAAS